LPGAASKKQAAVSGIPPLATTMQREDEPRFTRQIVAMGQKAVFAQICTFFVPWIVPQKMRKKISV
jgi:hypothetical protein